MQIPRIHSRTDKMLLAAVLVAVVIFFAMIDNNDPSDDVITANPSIDIDADETIAIEAKFDAPCGKIQNTTKKSRGKNSLRKLLCKICAS